VSHLTIPTVAEEGVGANSTSIPSFSYHLLDVLGMGSDESRHSDSSVVSYFCPLRYLFVHHSLLDSSSRRETTRKLSFEYHQTSSSALSSTIIRLRYPSALKSPRSTSSYSVRDQCSSRSSQKRRYRRGREIERLALIRQLREEGSSARENSSDGSIVRSTLSCSSFSFVV